MLFCHMGIPLNMFPVGLEELFGKYKYKANNHEITVASLLVLTHDDLPLYSVNSTLLNS